LHKENFRVLGLDQALKLMANRCLPNYSTVITIDDGWYATKARAHPLLKEKAYPYTVYQTSYYSMKQTPIYDLVVKFMFWKTRETQLNMAELGISVSGTVALTDPEKRERAIRQITKHGNSKLDDAGRRAVAQRLGKSLAVDYAEIEKSRILTLLSADDIIELSTTGVDFQLHTHRHRWPLEKPAALQELRENQQFLEGLTGRRPWHFCYPDGIWSYEQLPYLVEAGIKSATTTMGGINYEGAQSLHLLRRITDGGGKSQIRFEAEMSGYLSLLKKLQGALALRKWGVNVQEGREPLGQTRSPTK
jgi:peptidoglycan/xylan/chitin deacetylase (PgdA/CDA1 family)